MVRCIGGIDFPNIPDRAPKLLSADGTPTRANSTCRILILIIKYHKSEKVATCIFRGPQQTTSFPGYYTVVMQYSPVMSTAKDNQLAITEKGS